MHGSHAGQDAGAVGGGGSRCARSRAAWRPLRPLTRLPGVAAYETKTLLPLRKAAFLCSAKCCDTSGGHGDAFTQCLQQCASPPDSAEERVQRELMELQQRLSRSMAVCQDKAAGIMRDGGKEEKAQGVLESCVGEVVNSTQRNEVPKLFARLARG